MIDNTNNETLGFGSLDFIKHDHLKLTQKKGLLSPSHYLYEDISLFLIRELLSRKNIEINKQNKKIKKILIIFSSEEELKNFNRYYKIIKKFKLDLSFVYQSGEKLIYANKNNKYKYDLNKINIIKIIHRNDCIIFNENHLSLFFHYFNRYKKTFFHFRDSGKKIFIDKNNLFYSTNNLNYRKLFSNIYNNYYEIFLEITKQFLKRF